jgi:hypothetical protein
MRIIHWVGITPNGCGLYEHAKDQIAAERSVGIDAQAVDYRIVPKTTAEGVGEKESVGEIFTDDWLTSISLKEAKNADINVIHSGIPEKHKTDRPNILIMHGRPEYAFALAMKGNRSHYQEYMSYRYDERYQRFAYFWPEHTFTWEMIFPKKKLVCMPAFIDESRFTPGGKTYDLGETRGSVNLLAADIWREDVTPYNCTLAAAEFVKKYQPTAKVHIIGLGNYNAPAIQGHLGILKDNEVMGTAAGVISNPADFYRACDIMVSPQVIATRSIREAMCAGMVVVGGLGATYTPFTANPMDISGYAKAIDRAYRYWKRSKGRAKTEMNEKATGMWNKNQGGLAFKKLYEEMLA